jgi:hypothetical protein
MFLCSSHQTFRHHARFTIRLRRQQNITCRWRGKVSVTDMTLNNTEISRLHTPNIKFHKNLFHDSRHVVPLGNKGETGRSKYVEFYCLLCRHKTQNKSDGAIITFVQKNCQRTKLKKKSNDLCILIMVGLPRLCETFHFFQKSITTSVNMFTCLKLIDYKLTANLGQ